MKTLLRIDCSARITHSYSRSLADYFENQWKHVYPEGHVIYRDLAKYPPSHIQNDTIEGFFTPDDQLSAENQKAIALSDTLIEELISADIIVISSPLYNYNIPSTLKAYFDQVVRIRRTFDSNENRYYGLLKQKIAYLITVKGGFYKNTHIEHHDFQEAYLKVVLQHMGIEVANTFSLEGTSNPDAIQQHIAVLENTIQQSLKNQ